MHLWPSVPALCIKGSHLSTNTATHCLTMLISQVHWQSSRSLAHIQHGLCYALATGHHLHRITESHCPSGIQLFWNYIGKQAFPGVGENQICSWWDDDSELSGFLAHSKKTGLRCSICHQLLIHTGTSTLAFLFFPYMLLKPWHFSLLGTWELHKMQP